MISHLDSDYNFEHSGSDVWNGFFDLRQCFAKQKDDFKVNIHIGHSTSHGFINCAISFCKHENHKASTMSIVLEILKLLSKQAGLIKF